MVGNHPIVCLQCVGYGMGSAGSNTGSIIQIVQILRALRCTSHQGHPYCCFPSLVIMASQGLPVLPWLAMMTLHVVDTVKTPTIHGTTQTFQECMLYCGKHLFCMVRCMSHCAGLAHGGALMLGIMRGGGGNCLHHCEGILGVHDST